MAGSSIKSEWKHSRPPSKDSHSALPESSLSWCLAHLYRSGPGTENQVDAGSGKDVDKRFRVSQWRALVAIRTQHIKAGKAGIAKFRGYGGLRPLMNLLKQSECPRKTLDLALSILGNCCTEQDTRREVRKMDGINVLVDIMKRNVTLESVLNRAARALGNLAMDPDGSHLIHSAGGVPLLVLCLSMSSAPSSPTAAPPAESCLKLECAQSAARALLYLSDTPSSRLSLITQGAFSALAPLIAPEYPQGLRRVSLKTLHELTRGCGMECAREVSRSGVLAQLGLMVSEDSGKGFEELALKTLANMCAQGCLRPLVGSLGVIQKFTEEIKKDPLKSGVFLKALCLCCKEAVNRAKVKESGGLEVLTSFLASHQNHSLSRLAILACVDFVFDEAAMEQLQELGLVPLLVARLVKITREEEQTAEKLDASSLSGTSPKELLPTSCLESFDFPPPEGSKKEEACREQGSSSFLSLRSWLLSEGLISSEGDLLDSSRVDGECASLPSSSPSSSSLKTAQSPKVAVTPSASSSFSPAPSLFSTGSSSPAFSSSSETYSYSSPSSALETSSSASSKTSQASASPSKFSSPQKKRRVSSASLLAKVTLDSPPSLPRPAAAYQHPYHPEPWTPESPVLLLLSRFSHAGDPSGALVSSGVTSGLLYYLTQHQDPSSRCFRLLSRLSCNPNCLQALVRTGSVALIHHHLCQTKGGEERQTERVKAKVKQLGVAVLNNLRVQCESGFGSGVLSHVMLSGSESDRMNCALSLPFLNSNKTLLRKLLLDTGGLLLALKPLGLDADADDDDDEEGDDKDHTVECGRLLPDLMNLPPSGRTSRLRSLYVSLLIGCLSALTAKADVARTDRRSLPSRSHPEVDSTPPLKKPRLSDTCPYGLSASDLFLLLDDGSRLPVNRAAVGGAEGAGEVHSQYFRALLRGGFGEAQTKAEEAIRIKDATTGMLLPLLHYLHGCRFGGETSQGGGTKATCLILDTLVHDGLNICQTAKELSTKDAVFLKTPLGEAMVGACRFLVDPLQRDLEDLCVSLLWSSSSKAAPRGEPAADRNAEKRKLEQEFAEVNLASPTCEAELTGLKCPLLQTERKKRGFSGAEHNICTGLDALSEVTTKKVSPASKPVKEPPQWGEEPAAAGLVASLLPQMYCFSQRYNYPTLGRTCLSLLLGVRDGPPLFPSSSAAGVCLRRLAKTADSTETLKQDLLHLASAALS
ncbi:armadillo repeat-containing protein 5 [Oryzias latipes]|uniref:Armadillo repeat containing 5 n=1 Tax=Oryzias latipes TaxID=8090 RepID=H2L9S3_ORYLA|nr:armadillo repeat-containing protein 5 [Oryzias latipes]